MTDVCFISLSLRASCFCMFLKNSNALQSNALCKTDSFNIYVAGNSSHVSRLKPKKQKCICLSMCNTYMPIDDITTPLYNELNKNW